MPLGGELEVLAFWGRRSVAPVMSLLRRYNKFGRIERARRWSRANRESRLAVKRVFWLRQWMGQAARLGFGNDGGGDHRRNRAVEN